MTSLQGWIYSIGLQGFSSGGQVYNCICITIDAASNLSVTILPQLNELAPDTTIRDLVSMPPMTYAGYNKAKVYLDNVSQVLVNCLSAPEFSKVAPQVRRILRAQLNGNNDGINILDTLLHRTFPFLGWFQYYSIDWHSCCYKWYDSRAVHWRRMRYLYPNQIVRSSHSSKCSSWQILWTDHDCYKCTASSAQQVQWLIRIRVR